jgi:hypothetical protein
MERFYSPMLRPKRDLKAIYNRLSLFPAEAIKILQGQLYARDGEDDRLA